MTQQESLLLLAEMRMFVESHNYYQVWIFISRLLPESQLGNTCVTGLPIFGTSVQVGRCTSC